MSYGELVWSRIANWGTLLLALGAVAGLLSGRITAGLPEGRREKANLALKIAGLAAALVGALRVLNIIG